MPQLEARERKAQYRYQLFFLTALRAAEGRMSRCRDICKGQKCPQGWEGMFGLYKGRQHGTEVSFHFHSAKFHL